MLSWEDILEEIHYPHGNNLYYLNPSVGTHEIMQFTGLLDRHGKEIYERDIIKITKKVRALQIIGFDQEEARFCFVYQTGEPMRNIYPTEIPSFEIIGNIYENPELLI